MYLPSGRVIDVIKPLENITQEDYVSITSEDCVWKMSKMQERLWFAIMRKQEEYRRLKGRISSALYSKQLYARWSGNW